jgi:hypothetical protein
MLDYLGDAQRQRMDLPDGPALTVTHHEYTGHPGRPRIRIEPQFLQVALQLRGPTAIAGAIGCSSRTVRRRGLDAALLDPGTSPFQTVVQEDGAVTRVWVEAPRHTRQSDIEDDQLDLVIRNILDNFPNHGRRLIDGHLKSTGLHVSRKRVEDSYLRVHGPPAGLGHRRIVRRVYKVAGPNALWHHDGQHGKSSLFDCKHYMSLTLLIPGLIRWKLVAHAFIDGCSRRLKRARMHNNNRANTVLALFLQAVARYGVPMRMRGDHGTENILVAKWMDEHRFLGAYIWGRLVEIYRFVSMLIKSNRSVHNTRIERIWFDFTQGVGAKWKAFFLDLEANDELNPDSPTHISLLHWLFLDGINQDIDEWVAGWNSHVIELRGEPNRSPDDLFVFGMLENGSRGINHLVAADNAAHENDADYGIDWTVNQDPAIRRHFYENNPDEADDDGDADDGRLDIVDGLPAHMSHIECETDNAFLEGFTEQLKDALLEEFGAGMTSRHMPTRRLLWRRALRLSREIYPQLVEDQN